MAYVKNVWVDEVLDGAVTYEIDGVGGKTIELETPVLTPGTDFNAAKMNNIEEGIEDLDTNKYDSSDLASQAQAEAGTDNTTLMTPLRTKQALNEFAPIKYSSASAPTVSDDTGSGYIYGDLWRDTTNQDLYYYFGDDQDGAIWLSFNTAKKLFFYNDGTYGGGISDFDAYDELDSGNDYTPSNDDTGSIIKSTLTCTSVNTSSGIYYRWSDETIDLRKYKKIYIKYKADKTLSGGTPSAHTSSFGFQASQNRTANEKRISLTVDGTIRTTSIDTSDLISSDYTLTEGYITFYISTQTYSGSTPFPFPITELTIYEIWGV